MEGLYLEFVPGMGLLAAGVLLLAVLLAGVLYAWRRDSQQRATTAREALKAA